MDPARTDLPGSAARGVVGAMAMTGLRRLTTGLGLLSQPPPEMSAVEGVSGFPPALPTRERWGASDRVAVAADHVLYGLVVSGTPAWS